jgi:hypothetical protein
MDSLGLRDRRLGSDRQILAFVGGSTVLLDIVGPARLKRMEVQSADRLPKGESRIQRTYVGGIIVVIFVVVAVVAVTHPYNPQDEFPGEASTNPAVILALAIVIPVAIGIYWVMTNLLTWILGHNWFVSLVWPSWRSPVNAAVSPGAHHTGGEQPAPVSPLFLNTF